MFRTTSTDPEYQALFARFRTACEQVQLAHRSPARPELVAAAQERQAKAQGDLDAYRADRAKLSAAEQRTAEQHGVGARAYLKLRELPEDARAVALRDGLTAAEVMAIRSELSPALWKSTTTPGAKIVLPARTLLAAQRTTRAALRAQSPEGKRAARVVELEAKMAESAEGIRYWAQLAREEPASRAGAQAAADADRRRWTKARDELRRIDPTSAFLAKHDNTVSFSALADREAPKGPLPADVAPVAKAIAAVGNTLSDLLEELAAEGEVKRATRKAASDAIATYLEIVAGVPDELVDQAEEVQRALDAGDVDNLVATIEALAEAMGARLSGKAQTALAKEWSALTERRTREAFRTRGRVA